MVRKKLHSGKPNPVPPTLIKVGDFIRLMFGGRNIQGKVVENRGRIGVKGRNLYSVLVMLNNEPVTIEVPDVRVLKKLPARSQKTSAGSSRGVTRKRTQGKTVPA